MALIGSCRPNHPPTRYYRSLTMEMNMNSSKTMQALLPTFGRLKTKNSRKICKVVSRKISIVDWNRKNCLLNRFFPGVRAVFTFFCEAHLTVGSGNARKSLIVSFGMKLNFKFSDSSSHIFEWIQPEKSKIFQENSKLLELKPATSPKTKKCTKFSGRSN